MPYKGAAALLIIVAGHSFVMAQWDMTHAWLYTIHMQPTAPNTSEVTVGNDVLNP